MNDAQEIKDIKEMTTTSSFILTIGQVRWIEQEAERIKALPKTPKKFNKSTLVRQILDRAMTEAESSQNVEAA